MVPVEGGTFEMGATEEQNEDSLNDELPIRNVTLDSFLIGQTLVTQELWELIMGSNPSKYKGRKNPVENVSWYDCKEFVKKLNSTTNLEFRLPTEAEWEYAARGGNRSSHFKYSGSNDIDDVGWFWRNSGDRKFEKAGDDPDSDFDGDQITTNIYNCKPHNVGSKQPNELGLYDMSGNVSEWCEDWEGSYDGLPVTNPLGPKEGHYRMCRGGDCYGFAWNCRVSYRCGERPDLRDEGHGMRLALSEITGH